MWIRITSLQHAWAYRKNDKFETQRNDYWGAETSCRLCALFSTMYKYTTYAFHSDPKLTQIGNLLVATSMAGNLYSACISNLLQNRHYYRLTQSRRVHADLSHSFAIVMGQNEMRAHELVRMSIKMMSLTWCMFLHSVSSKVIFRSCKHHWKDVNTKYIIWVTKLSRMI